MFTFILNLVAVNATTIMKHNVNNFGNSRRTFLRNFTTSLALPHLKNRTKFLLREINEIPSCYENITIDIERYEDIENVPDSKSHLCLKSFHGL